MAKVGDLVVQLALSQAEFQRDLGKAAANVEHATKRIESAVEGAKRGLELLGLALSVEGIKHWAESVLEAAENLQNFASETGSSVENLSRLANIAKVSGTSFDTIRGAIDRLAAGLAGSEEGTSKTAAALQFLGISARDPALALKEIAEKLNDFSDGAGKAAIARDLFGRGGVQLLSTLKSIADAEGIEATMSSEQTRKATELVEAYRKLRVGSVALQSAFLDNVVPALSAVITKMTAGIALSGGLRQAIANVTSIGLTTSPADAIAKSRADIDHYEKELAAEHAKGDQTGIFGAGTVEQRTTNIRANLERARQQLELAKKFQRDLIDTNDPTNFDSRDRRLRQKPDLPYVSKDKNAAGDDPRKKILEGQLKALDALFEEEKQTLQARGAFLEAYYQHADISLKEYFAGRQQSLSDGVAEARKDYGQEIKALQEYIAKRDITEVDRAEAQNKVADVRKKLASVERDAAHESVKLWFQEREASEQYRDSITDINARLLEMQGHTGDAERLRQRNEASLRQRRTLERNGDTEALAQLDAINQQAAAQKDYNDAAQETASALQLLEITQQRISSKQQSGALSELDALAATSRANLALIPLLKKRADEEERIAQTLSGPEKDRALLGVEQLRARIEDLGAQTDLVAKKFNDVFSNSFSNSLAELVDGTKTFRQAFGDLVRDIDRDISRIAINNLSSALFGDGKPGNGAPLSGIGGFFSSLLSGGSSAGGSAALAGAGTVLTAAGTSLGVAATALTSAAAALATGSAASGGGGIAALLADIPAFASGTTSAPGGLALVGERGPELVRLSKGAQVIPNDVFQQRRAASGGNNIQIHINVPGGTSRATADQVAAATARSVQRVMGRGTA